MADMLRRLYARLVPETGAPRHEVHAEAEAAIQRAQEAHIEAIQQQGRVDRIVSSLRVHSEINHFGEMLEKSMGRPRA